MLPFVTKENGWEWENLHIMKIFSQQTILFPRFMRNIWNLERDISTPSTYLKVQMIENLFFYKLFSFPMLFKNRSTWQKGNHL